MSSSPLRWALIGASDIAATRMIPAFRALDHEVVVVQSGSPDWAEQYAQAHGIAHWTTSVEEAVARGDVDAVYVSSTNDKHRVQVEAAAAAGRHVLAEKPLALTVADAQAMVDACTAAGVVMATNHHLPASPTHRTMRELVAGGAVGEVRAIYVSHAGGLPERLRTWRLDDPATGGVLLDIFVHDMAATAAIIGGQALRVASLARPGVAVPDSVMSVVEWEGEVIVETHDAYDNFHLPTSFAILGTEGAIRSTDCMTGDPIGDVVLYRGREGTVVDVGPREDLYVVTARAFAQAVAGEGEPVVSGQAGVRSLAAALAARASLASGGTEPVARA